MKENYWWLTPHIEDIRDFKAQDVFWDTNAQLESKFSLLDYVSANNQWNTLRCTNYAKANLLSALNNFERWYKKNEWKFIIINADKLWGNCLKTYPDLFSEKTWWPLRETIKSAQKNWYEDLDWNKYKIKGFAISNKNVGALKNAIKMTSKSFLKWVYTGCDVFKVWWKTQNFTLCKSNWKLHILRWEYDRDSWHTIIIIGWDDNIFWEWKWWFLCLNSYWNKWGFYKNWTFYIPYEEISWLYWPYIVYDITEEWFLFKDVSISSPYYDACKFCLEKWIIRWYNWEAIPDSKDRIFWVSNILTLQEYLQIKKNLWKLFGGIEDIIYNNSITRWEFAQIIYKNIK